MSGDRSTLSKVMASTLNPRLPGNSFAREVGGFVYSQSHVWWFQTLPEGVSYLSGT